MKCFASFLLVASFAAAQLAFAEDETPQKQQKGRRPAANGSRSAARNAELGRRLNAQPSFQRKFNTAPQSTYHPQRVQTNSNVNRQLNVNRPERLSPRVYNPANTANNLVNPELRGRGGHNWRGNGQANDGERNANNWKGDGDRNWRNRKGDRDRGRWANSRNWERSRHDRGWWRNRYTRFALFGGGYYYYNSGFWYPAYGYDPYFSNYSYDAPIYAYNDQDPGQVIGNVQTELSRRGYDAGPIDGTYGPATRNALLNFQADNGLEESGEIDEATLDALGLQ